jgi:hypothetical protein
MNSSGEPGNLGVTVLRVIKMTVLQIGGVVLPMALVICGFLCWAFGRGMCGNEVVHQVYSPNGRYKVIVFERNCGATTGYTTHISVLGSNTSLGGRVGNVLGADGHPDLFELEVEWQDDTLFVIQHDAGFVPVFAKDKVRGIQVQYLDRTN